MRSTLFSLSLNIWPLDSKQNTLPFQPHRDISCSLQVRYSQCHTQVFPQFKITGSWLILHLCWFFHSSNNWRSKSFHGTIAENSGRLQRSGLTPTRGRWPGGLSPRQRSSVRGEALQGGEVLPRSQGHWGQHPQEAVPRESQVHAVQPGRRGRLLRHTQGAHETSCQLKLWIFSKWKMEVSLFAVRILDVEPPLLRHGPAVEAERVEGLQANQRAECHISPPSRSGSWRRFQVSSNVPP